ncbi:MAG: MDR/zinc-dependent alcohol dehydrogenase-like family protein [Tepidisphaeraceae bacterium]
MKALVFDQTLRFDPHRAVPAAGLGDSLVRVHQAGVCSTDIEITRGYMNFTGILGHEFVGTVEASPDPKLLGQRVVGEINCPCGRCDLCMGGLSNHCRDRTVLGIQRHDGAFAERLRLPAANLHVLPEKVDDDQAVFVEPLAAAFQVLKQVRVDPTKWVTVLGDGRLGLLTAQVLRNAGCQVRLIGKHPEKLALCEKWQIRSRLLSDIAPRHDQDIVVDCTGSAGGFELAMQMVRPRGTIVLKSTVAQGKPLNLAPLVIDEITVVGSRCGPFREAIRALADGTVDVLSLISRRMKLEQGVEALAVAGRAGVLKVILSMT